MDASHQIGMSNGILDSQFAADHANSISFQPVFTTPFGGHFPPNDAMSSLPNGCATPAPMFAQSGMYAAQDLNSFWKPSPSGQLVKMEPGADLFAPHAAPEFPSYSGAQPMMSSMSLPTYATHVADRRFTFSDAESLCSVASPSSTSEASSRPTSAKRGAKRKQLTDVSLDSPAVIGASDASDAAKSKKTPRQTGQRRPPPSASHVTESGKPFPVIDTSAKHSSLFVPPDTSGLTKREARLVKNRAAAFLSRQRKREQFEEMEIKCKGISMLVWRMWEVIAGPDAGLECVNSTPLAAVLANEEPMARLCLEEVISKKGASIAPTADETDGTPAPEVQAPFRASAAPASSAQSSAQKDAELASAELDRARSDLAASLERERALLSQVDALRASLASTQNSMVANTVPVGGFQDSQQDWKDSALGVASMPFKAVQGAELPLFVPESPLSKFTMSENTNVSMMLDASHTGFDLSKTPTLAMFTENALRSRAVQQFGNGKATGTGMGLGLDYQFPCASTPSSPSTASSSSMESSQSRPSSSVSSNASAKAPSTLATVLLLASMSLMGVGPAAHEVPSTEARAAAPRKNLRAIRRSYAKTKAVTRAASPHNDGQPSSHLSDDDLLMEMGLEPASLSEAGDGLVEASAAKPSCTASMQPASLSALSCA